MTKTPEEAKQDMSQALDEHLEAPIKAYISDVRISREEVYGKPKKPAGQSKRHSFLEAVLNTAIGFLVSMAANMIVLPWFGFKVTVQAAFGIGVIFTVISIVRSYLLRRLFNRIMIWRQAK